LNKRKHHFIPRFILKNFTDSDKLFLYRYDKKEVFEVSIGDAFTKNNLNTIIDRNNQEQPNFIEDIYDKYFEQPASLSIKKIITDLNQIPPTGKDFSLSDYVTLLRFSVLSNFRTPYTMDSTHHAARVGAYANILLKYFIDYGSVNFPYELEIEKGLLFSHLENFDEAIKLLADLKLTLYYHRIPNFYFLIPDQFVIISSPNNSKFADKELKMYYPISSNVVVCFERIKRDFSKATCEIDNDGVEQFNLYFTNNSYDAIGCQNRDYLRDFMTKNIDRIKSLKKFDPYEDFSKIKQQIKLEIISKLALNNKYLDSEKSIITHINRNHEFRILSEAEYKESIQNLNSVIDIKKRTYKSKNASR
jgi:hypothetical protein